MFVLSFGLTQFQALGDGLLCRGDDAVLVAPVANFSDELRRIKLPPSSFQAVPSDYFSAETNLAVELADLRSALEQAGKSSNEVQQIIDAHRKERTKLANFNQTMERWINTAEAWETDADGHSRQKTTGGPRFPQINFTDGLPAEFGDYLEGTLAWHNPAFMDKGFARIAWERILSRPAKDRFFKSTWAAFMLGRSWEKENPAKAMEFYEKTRALANAGFADTLGLAAASLGQEARLCLNQSNYEHAIELYLQQLATGDDGAERSLITTLRAVVTGSSDGFPALAENPVTRRVVTAYVIATHALHISLANVAAPTRMTHDWLVAAEAANVDDTESIEALALAAYQNEEWETAQRWIDRAGSSVVAQWLQAKLLLRNGKISQAESLLAKAAHSISLKRPDGQQEQLIDNLSVPTSSYYTSESAAALIEGELGVFQVARGNYAGALDWFVRAGLEEDAFYVAERVLTVDELKAWVDAHFQPAEDGEAESYDAYHRYNIRYLLARRLLRELRGDEARAYFPEEYLPEYDSLARALIPAWNESLPASERAKALFDAACNLRTNGMSLIGTAMGPDWRMYHGAERGCVCAAIRTNSNFTLFPASTDELRRAAAHHPDPDMRFHYRYQAAFLAWEAAKLMPNNSEDTARVLCIAGSWIKYQDPETADLFYKALVRRNRKTEIGAEADRIRWFPELDDEGNLVSETPDPGSAEFSVGSEEGPETEGQMDANETINAVEVDHVDYFVQAGDTPTRIAAILGITVRELIEANQLQTDRLMIGQTLRIPVK